MEISMTSIFKTRHLRWVICGCCKGSGQVDHPAFRNGFTSEEQAEMACDWDAESQTTAWDRYMAGAYDVRCDVCDGTGKVREPDFATMPRDERLAYVRFLRNQREEVEVDRIICMEMAAERRMGC